MKKDRLADVLAASDFAGRHIGTRADDLAPMLDAIGVPSMDALIAETIPESIREKNPLDLGPALSEAEALQKIRGVAGKNRVLTSMVGQGYYGTFLPTVIQRNVLENPAWYTAYTPYQSEISQGRLEALLTFQTKIADLTALEVANASLLDEATAAAEAMAMARRISHSKAAAFFVDADCHPQTIAVMHTRAAPLGWEIVVGDPMRDLDPGRVFGALFQYPGCSGAIRDFRKIIADVHAAGAMAAMAADPLALTLLAPPGELGADIAVGSSQRFGLPMGYGGPHAAFIASRATHQRALPGRLVGVSVDARGRAAYRLALQTREQHIRREKATSNICTAQVLPAIIAAMYAVYHGPQGITKIARNVHRSCSIMASGLERLGWRISQRHFFDTVTLEVGNRQAEILARAVRNGINLRRVESKTPAIGISCDETTTPAVIKAVWDAFACSDRSQAAAQLSYETLAQSNPDALSSTLRRESSFLKHPVFNSYQSETEMLRYLRRLADRDLALDRSMIPLGSCTMKLNSTTEMMPLSWPEFANLHPFAPADQAGGYAEIISDLSEKLRAITGFDAISLQPNSGAQGEYAGLLVICAYHHSRGEGHRKICLIPSSAHGTNPASAHMAGMDVVVVNCDAAGNVDAADLQKKAEEHAQRIAALMITYPSTHGVFEPGIRAICDVMHSVGGQVYLDGANLNAQVGLARPGDYGADVGHINLHKTFCIPHGGGGPGMGPIGVKAHLAPFLPGHLEWAGGARQIGPVSAAPFGSASILTISWMYILLMGGDGLGAASQAAILNANYIAARLGKTYPLLFKGQKGRVAHECILDVRGFKDTAGVLAEDIAKRLMDYGFHAPTMSFPVPGTLMVEPTESESRAELDRFCDAILAIREEIRAIETGKAPRDDNVLRNAPHTALDLADEKWAHSYSRAQACFPSSGLRSDKYWPPVNRVDNAYGDRHPICTCPTPAELEDAAA
jgi:glycine cleavage system P protein (glycine dehydrogenase)